MSQNLAPLRHASAEAAMAHIAQETRKCEGSVPRSLDGVAVKRGESRLGTQSFLLRTESGLGFYYRRGAGITVERPAGTAPGEEALWLAGSVHAAIAVIGGLLPLHASAVVHDGRIYAFAGASGAGKSTLVAALASRDLAVFADDTLLIDLGEPGHLVCLPGHKRLKLAEDALTLTGARGEEAVGAGIAKRYATPAAQAEPMPLPLAALIFLDQGDDIAVERLGGGEAIARLDEDHYTQRFYAAATGATRADLFAQRSRIARQAVMARLRRPLDRARFDDSVAAAARFIRSGGRSA